MTRTTSAANNDLYYRLKERWVRSFDKVIPIDVDDDGVDELAIQIGEQVDIRDIGLNYYDRSFQISGPARYQISPLLPAKNGSLPFLASYHNEDSSVHNILLPTDMTGGKSIPDDSLNSLITYYRPKKTSKYDFHQGLTMISHYKNRFGQDITLFTTSTSWDVQGKRGLLAADIYKVNILWEKDFAPMIHNINLADIDGDNEVEIIIGTYANQNGLNVAGTTDDSSYVFVFEADGREKWKRSIGPYWTGAWVGVGNFENNRRKNLVVYQYSRRITPTNQDEIQILDAQTGNLIVQPKRIGNQFTFPWNKYLNICNDFNGDGRDEIIVGGTDGFVRLLNGELTEIEHSESFENKHVRVGAVEDLDGDGSLEIVCTIPNERVVIMDHSLNTLYSWLLPAPTDVSINVVHGEKKVYLLASIIQESKTVYRLFELQKSIYPFETVKQVKKTTLWLVVGCVFILFFIFIRNVFFGTKARKLLPSLLEQADLMDRCLLVAKNGNIQKIGRQWETMLQIQSFHLSGKHWKVMTHGDRLKPIESTLDEFIQQRVTEKSFAFSVHGNGEQIAIKLKSLYLHEVKTFCFMMFDMSEEEHIRQVKHWAQVAQRLAHGIKNPLTTVKLNAEELRHVLETNCPNEMPDTEEYFDAMIHQVNKLKKMSDGFMQFVEFEKPNLKPSNLNEITTDLVNYWQPEKSTGIEINLDFENGLSPTMLDSQQFEFALKNIFFNAVESLPGRGRILISTRKVQLLDNKSGSYSTSKFNELQIRDTGCGIPPEFLDKITQPYFTRNKIEGTGLGLSIVQKIMDSHEGQLEIQSELDVGTTVSLRFKINSD